MAPRPQRRASGTPAAARRLPQQPAKQRPRRDSAVEQPPTLDWPGKGRWCETSTRLAKPSDQPASLPWVAEPSRKLTPRGRGSPQEDPTQMRLQFQCLDVPRHGSRSLPLKPCPWQSKPGRTLEPGRAPGPGMASEPERTSEPGMAPEPGRASEHRRAAEVGSRPRRRSRRGSRRRCLQGGRQELGGRRSLRTRWNLGGRRNRGGHRSLGAERDHMPSQRPLQ